MVVRSRRRLLHRQRRECPELGWGQWQTIEGADPRVLVIEACWRGRRVVTLHNLSADPVTLTLPGDLADLGDVVQVLGDPGPPCGPDGDVTLGRYGFRWLRLPDE